MTGGLIQLVTSGKQDMYLTKNPEITFFKKVYRRHTNFSLEIKEVYSDQEAEWGNVVSFTLPEGDLIHRCFIEINLPKLSFDDSSILDLNYIAYKENLIQRLTNENLKWYNLYNNFKNYVNIELQLYQKLQILFYSDNITLNSIKELVVRFNNSFKTQKNLYSNLIDINVFNKINISGYLLAINKLLTYDNINNQTYISLNTIKNQINQQYNYINEYARYYHSNWKLINNKLNKAKDSKINFAWNQFLAHFYFTRFELEIGGQIIEQYSSDQLHIFQMHHLTEDQINNYYNMIGQYEELISYNNNEKPNKIIICPLLFWFCKKAGASLPIIAMRNTSVHINLTINDINKILYFRDYENEYYNIKNIMIFGYDLKNYNLNIQTNIYNSETKQHQITLTNINNHALKIIYPNLNDSEINFILTTFGNNNILELKDWIIFKNNLSNYPNLIYKIGNYDNYINYNLLINQIPKPNIKLLVEYGFIDDVERNKFASSKLEYVVETFQENIFDVNNYLLFDGDVSIDRPNKYLKWFIQPKIFLNGLSEYGKTYSHIYDFSNYFINTIYNKQIFTLNQIDIVNHNIPSSYYKLVTSYKGLNRILPDGVFYYNFCLYPEDSQPSGTANLTMIKEKKFRYEINKEFLNEYFTSKLNINQIGLQFKILSTTYNFFVVNNGNGKLVFAN
jgi:hypothetical protein